MIAIKTLRLVHLFSYVLVTSQVLFYLFILCDALKVVSLANYFEQRKVIDTLMGSRFRLMYYTCLALSILVVIFSSRQPGTFLFISSVVALIFLVIDLTITVKGSLPLNALANTFHSASGNVNWEKVRAQWLTYMKYRGIVITIGMASLLAGLVFEKS